MALVEKNENLKGKMVKMDGMTISWGDEDDVEEVDGLDLEPDNKPVEIKTLKTKDDNQKTKKVVI